MSKKYKNIITQKRIDSDGKKVSLTFNKKTLGIKKIEFK
jgi:hypothetical protein